MGDATSRTVGLAGFSTVSLGRAVEQASLLLAPLIVALGTSPEEFAPVAVLVTLASAAVAVGDLGVTGLILRAPTPGLPRSARQPMLVTVGVLLLVAIVGVAVGGTTGRLLTGGAVVWVTTGIAQVLRAVGLRAGAHARILGASVLGATALVAISVAALVLAGRDLTSTNAIWVIVVGLAAKNLGECLPLLGFIRWIPGSGLPWYFVANRAVNFLAGNIDFIVVGAMIGPAALAVYLLAFRVAGGVYSVLGNTVVRLGTVAVVETPIDERAPRLRSWGRQLVLAGFGLAAVIVLAAPILQALLGSAWSDALDVTRVLSLLLPFRLLHALVSAALTGVGSDGPNFGLEVARLVLTTAAMVVAAPLGILAVAWFVVLAAVPVAVLDWIVLERELRAPGDSGHRPPPPPSDTSTAKPDDRLPVRAPRRRLPA